jgi:hypothetical protein
VPNASAMLAFFPLDGGCDEFVGVFGGLPARPSSSAMRASSAPTHSMPYPSIPCPIDCAARGENV